MKFYQSGRSMVEMLGVLAIIGVLSVGAISGYSKAMMKYKLNKQAESINMLLFNAFQISHKIKNTSTSNSSVFLSEIMYKLNLLPDGITIDEKSSYYLKDPFNNSIWIYAYPSMYGMGYAIQSGEYGRIICQNLVEIYKQYANILKTVSSDQQSKDDENNGAFTSNGTYYGGKNCNSSRKCIKDIGLDDITTLCHQCSTSNTSCRLYVTWE